MTALMDKINTKIIPLEIETPNMLKSINFYLVQENESLFLIDAGLDNDSYWEYLQHTLQVHGFELSDLTAILLTHHHFDHVGLVHRIAKLQDTPVYIHPYALPKLKGDPEFLYRSYQFFLEITEKLNTGSYGREQADARYDRQMNKTKSALDWNVHAINSDNLFGFQVIGIPGHAPDQVAFYLQDEKIIFLGDLLIDHLRSNAFVEPAFDGSPIAALEHHIGSLKKIIELKPEIALSGHGKVIEEPVKLAQRRLDAIDAKARSFLSSIEAGIRTGSEIIKQRHPNKYEKIFFTLLSDALSFLHYLEAKEAITKKERNGVWYWEPGPKEFNM